MRESSKIRLYCISFGIYGAMQDFFFLPLTPQISDSLRKNTSRDKNEESAFHLNAIQEIS